MHTQYALPTPLTYPIYIRINVKRSQRSSRANAFPPNVSGAGKGGHFCNGRHSVADSHATAGDMGVGELISRVTMSVILRAREQPTLLEAPSQAGQVSIESSQLSTRDEARLPLPPPCRVL